MSPRAGTVRLAAALGILLAAPAAAVATAAGPARAATGVPYTDPAADGYLGLCNQAGQQVTSGSVNTTPFAWRAVSSVPAPSPYNNTGRTAVLDAFQPQQELPPGDWSGQQLTSSSRYSNPTNPMAAGTDGDGSLETFIQAFPPKWDGFIELRMYLGTDNEPAYQVKYPVLNLKVTGSTWHAVGGGTVNCSSGTAESIETMLLPPSTTTTAPKAATQPAAAGTTAGGGSSGTSGGSGGNSPASGTSSASGTVAKGGSDAKPATTPGATPETASSSSTPVGLVVGIIAAVLVVLAAVWLLWLLLVRRRRSGRAGPTADPGSGGAQGGGGPPGSGTAQQPAAVQTDSGEGPVQDLDLATSQKAATKGESR